MNNVKKLRNENNLSLQGLANKTGISKSTLSNYEHGRAEPTPKNAEILADLFKVWVPYIKGDSDVRNIHEITSLGKDISDGKESATIPENYTDSDAMTLDIEFIVAELQKSRDPLSKSFLIRYILRAINIYKLAEKNHIDDTPFDELDDMFEMLYALVLKTYNDTKNKFIFYELLVDFDEAARNFYKKNKTN